MLRISSLKKILKDQEAQMPILKSSDLVFDENNMQEKLAKKNKADFPAVLAVIPVAKGIGKNTDSRGYNNIFTLFFLEPHINNWSDDEFHDALDRMQPIVESFITGIIDNNPQYFIDHNKINIEYERNYIGHSGYSVAIQIEDYPVM